MPASQFTPLSPDTFYWDTSVTTYKGAPVVRKGSTAFTATNPAGTSADKIIGVSNEDAGPSAPNQAVNAKAISVSEGPCRVAMYGKGTIHTGDVVKIGPTISITPAGYASAITVYTCQTMAQTTAGSQPYPVLGYADSEGAADGDIVYVKLVNGMYY